jgi:opacity protein-like surface antigen
MKRIFLVGLLTAAAACAQGLSVGVYAGAPFTDVEQNTTISGISYVAKSPKFVVGGGLQLNLPLHLRLELDALARGATYRASNQTADTNATEWRFPLIMQYRFATKGVIQPFIGVGASFAHIYQIKNAVTSGTGSFASNSPAGMLIDGGLDFNLKPIRISAELRYTRQFNDAVVSLSQLNQADVLVGIHF